MAKLNCAKKRAGTDDIKTTSASSEAPAFSDMDLIDSADWGGGAEREARSQPHWGAHSLHPLLSPLQYFFELNADILSAISVKHRPKELELLSWRDSAADLVETTASMNSCL
ncbi:hypothetical protein JZ751_006710 [Albula glossodonta]|uniref:Uncharacterized protein n=1 Tax=Albula glossodonta TaxID=121402 RepID=A0A8T2P255_9TELE|nr:hypothetical protein JZ751_006710 [Albula glossodonta]